MRLIEFLIGRIFHLHKTKTNGFEFVEFKSIEKMDVKDYSPIAGSFAVINCKGRYLLCYNIWRKQWEIPAGQREKNETSKECAMRELNEETGQKVDDLEFKGLLKLRNLSTDNVKYNPVYYTTVEELQPFQDNNETSKIMLWDLKEEIGYIDRVDLKLFDYI